MQTGVDWRFDRLDEDIAELRVQLRAIAPVVGTSAAAEVKLAHVERDVAELKADLKDVLLRGATLRIVIVMAPILLACTATITAALTGMLG